MLTWMVVLAAMVVQQVDPLKKNYSGATSEGAGKAGRLARVECETVVAASRSEAWKAWTTNEGAQKFFAAKTNIELRLGGPFEIYFMPDAPEGQRGAEGCRIISYVPEEMLSFEWNAPPQFPTARAERTWVVVRLEQAGERRTRVRLAHEGFAERVAAKPENRAEYEKVRSYFASAWPKVLEWLKSSFDEGEAKAGPSGDENGRTPERAGNEEVLGLVRRLVGGEWVHEHEDGKGGVFRARNVLESGPDGKSIHGRGWLGGKEGMFLHGVTQIWREPGSGEVRFQNISESGAVARGELTMKEGNTVVWDWRQWALDGTATSFRVDMIFDGMDRYRMRLFREQSNGDMQQQFEFGFERVESVKEEFKRMRGAG